VVLVVAVVVVLLVVVVVVLVLHLQTNDVRLCRQQLGADTITPKLPCQYLCVLWC
jgi:hypothetical protein